MFKKKLIIAAWATFVIGCVSSVAFQAVFDTWYATSWDGQPATNQRQKNRYTRQKTIATSIPLIAPGLLFVLYAHAAAEKKKK